MALGACAKRLLKEFGMRIVSWVSEIGGAKMPALKPMGYGEFDALFSKAERSEVRCPDHAAAKRMMKRIDWAKKNGDSLGGIIEVACLGVAPGLGSHVQWDRKLDGRLARALMSVKAIKAVEVGIGFAAARTPGSKTHDEASTGRGRESPAMPIGLRVPVSTGAPTTREASREAHPTESL